MRGGAMRGGAPHGIGDSLLARLEGLKPGPPGHRVRRVLILLLLLLVIGSIGCDGGAASDGGNAAAASKSDTLTRRQRDSAIGASPLPAARGVRGALEAADSAAARARYLDSIGGSP